MFRTAPSWLAFAGALVAVIVAGHLAGLQSAYNIPELGSWFWLFCGGLIGYVLVRLLENGRRSRR